MAEAASPWTFWDCRAHLSLIFIASTICERSTNSWIAHCSCRLTPWTTWSILLEACSLSILLVERNLIIASAFCFSVAMVSHLSDRGFPSASTISTRSPLGVSNDVHLREDSGNISLLMTICRCPLTLSNWMVTQLDSHLVSFMFEAGASSGSNVPNCFTASGPNNPSSLT